MFSYKLLSVSRLSLFVIFIYGLIAFFSDQVWKKNPISNNGNDVVLYYAYAPAALVFHDLSLKYQNDPQFPKNAVIWDRTEDGHVSIKMTMGLSYLYGPFFLLGHIYANHFHYPTDGYSDPYVISVLLGAFLILIIGLIYLRKILLRYFPDPITALILLCIYFGTNLLWYATGESMMAHQYLFSIMCIWLYFMIKWHERSSFKNSVAVGLLFGLLVLIRPTMVISSLFFIFYKVDSIRALKEKILFFFKKRYFLLVILLVMVLPIIPQLYYWHLISGRWIYYSYRQEHFYFGHPHIIDGLFSFRKGWLLYTPIMLFAITGIFLPNKATRSFSFSTFLTLSTCIYVFFSWWTWWFGGSFGCRPMIEYYGILAIPIGNFFMWTSERNKTLKRVVIVITCIFVYLNIFQTWQYKKGLLHYDSMTRKAYFTHFLKNEVNVRHYTELRHPDYNRAKNGLPFEYPPLKADREFFAIVDFEVPDTSNIHLTQEIKNGGNFSCKIPPGDTSVNILTFEAVDLMQYAPDTIFFSADVFAREAISEGELTFTYKLKNDSSVYEEKNIDIKIDRNKTNSWNTIAFGFPFRAYGERTNVMLGVKQKSTKTIYVDNVFVEFDQLKKITKK